MFKVTSILFFVFTFVISNAQTPCASAVNIYSFTFNGANYEVVKEAKTWTAAAACAVQRGGYLVEINNQAEQNAVYNGIVAAGVSGNYSPLMDGGGASYVWIGATDKSLEGIWLWDGNNDNSGLGFWNGQGLAGAGTGSAVGGAFVNWGGKSNSSIQEPDDYGNNQDAAAIAVSSWPYGISGEWNDVALSNSIYYVIEYPSTSGIHSIEKDVNIQIFPNPTKDKIELKSTIELKKIEIRAVEGKVVRSIYPVKQTLMIELNGLPKGVYTMELTTNENALITRKIIKE